MEERSAPQKEQRKKKSLDLFLVSIREKKRHEKSASDKGKREMKRKVFREINP